MNGISCFIYCPVIVAAFWNLRCYVLMNYWRYIVHDNRHPNSQLWESATNQPSKLNTWKPFCHSGSVDDLVTIGYFHASMIIANIICNFTTVFLSTQASCWSACFKSQHYFCCLKTHNNHYAGGILGYACTLHVNSENCIMGHTSAYFPWNLIIGMRNLEI